MCNQFQKIGTNSRDHQVARLNAVKMQTAWSQNANKLESNTNKLESKRKRVGVKMRTSWSDNAKI
eukprot:4634003-Amphidinium_carterae.1